MVHGLTGAVFPRVSNALAADRPDVARSVANEAVRFVVIIFTMVCAVTACSSQGIMTLLFGARYGEGHPFLTLLVFALCLSGVLKLMFHLLAAADRPGPRLAFVLGMLPLAVGLNLFLIPRFGARGAALASLATMTVGAFIGSIMAYRFIGVLPSIWTIGRCLIAAGAVFAVGTAWPAEGILVIAKLVALSASYLGLIMLLGEVKPRDIRSIWRNVPLGAAKASDAQAGLGGEP